MARPPVRRGFATPPEVTGYFDQKTLRPAFAWLDVWGEEHAHAFTVAKATEVELLTAFRSSISGAIAGGKSFETWRAGLEPELRRLGWWGPRRVADPPRPGQAGDPDRLVDFSGPRRLKTIFWSNMQAARSAGQWERIQRTKRALPYILYVRTAASDPRPEHLTWAGIVLPADDPFWRTHFPPNGWGCKCSVRQITGRERDRLLSPEAANDVVSYRASPPHDGSARVFRNRRTGQVTEIPAGIDPGWHTNPGLARARTLAVRLQTQLEEAGPEAARDAVQELLATPTPRVVLHLPEQAVRLPVAVSTEAAAALGARSPLIVVSNETMLAKTATHLTVGLETFLAAQDFIDAGVLVDRGQPNRRSVVVRREDGWWQLVIARSVAGFLRIASIHRISTRRAERFLSKDVAGDKDAAGRT